MTGVTREASSEYLSTVFLSLDGRSAAGPDFLGVGVFLAASACASPFFLRPRFFSGCCGVVSSLASAGAASSASAAGGSAAAGGEAGLASSEAMGGKDRG